MTDPIEHRDECSAPQVSTFTGRLGDRIARCAGCGRVTVLEATAGTSVHLSAGWTLPPLADHCDHRQRRRDGSHWPTHKARRRRRAARKQRRDRLTERTTTP